MNGKIITRLLIFLSVLAYFVTDCNTPCTWGTTACSGGSGTAYSAGTTVCPETCTGNGWVPE